ncbi:zinc finger matrin-type protein 1 isoform X2 [Lepisosteus oculatus]
MFCKVCGAVLQYESQRISHYEGKKHTQKVRLYLQARKPQVEAGVKRSRESNFQYDGAVDRSRFCQLCNMVFSSPVVAQSHYVGKVHTKKLKKLGLPPVTGSFLQEQTDEAAPPPAPSAPAVPEPVAPPSPPEEQSQGPGVDLSDANKHCRLCAASFNNPLMAQQHYSGRKHQRSAARSRVGQELGEEAGAAARSTGGGTFVCPVCSVTLGSAEMHQAHMRGNKHQNQEPGAAAPVQGARRKVYGSFQDELADYIQEQRARGLGQAAGDGPPPGAGALLQPGPPPAGTQGLSTQGAPLRRGGVRGCAPRSRPLRPGPGPQRRGPPWGPRCCPPLLGQSQFGPRGPEGPPWAPAFPSESWDPQFEERLNPLLPAPLAGDRGCPPHRARAQLRESSQELSSPGSEEESSGSSSRAESSRRRKRKRERRARGGSDPGEEEEETRHKRRKRQELAKQDRQRPEKSREEGEERPSQGPKEEKHRQKKWKHRKEKREKKEEVDSRTEEEKLWDESILGLM